MDKHQESFLNYLKYEKRFSSHTLTAYSNDLGQFEQFCFEVSGEFNIYKADSKLLRGWVIALMEKNISPKSVNRKVSAIKSFFKYLMKNELVSQNPVLNIPLPKIRKKLPSFVGTESLDHLLDDGFFPDDFEGVRDKLIVSLFYCTGIRLSELVSLKEVNVDTRESTVKVLGKRNKERIIPYPRSLNPLIGEYVLLKAETFGANNGWLFVTSKGERVYSKLVYRVVKNNLGKVTLLEKKSPHVLRHSYATHLLNKGADLNAVKELLGHSSLAATQIYTHTTFEKLQSIYKQTHPRG